MAKTIRFNYQAYAVSLHLIYRTWYWRNFFGYSLQDLSFLADIELKLLQSIEDPTLRIGSAKQSGDGVYQLSRISVGEYDLDQLDFIRSIFYQIDLEDLVPKEFFPEDLIEVAAVCEISPGKRHLKIYQAESERDLRLLYDFDKSGIPAETLKFSQDIEKLKNIIASLFYAGYFDQPRLAIEIYKHIIEQYRLIAKPIVLERAMRIFTAKKKGPRIARQIKRDSHTLFVKII